MPKCPRTRSSRISLAEILVVTDRPVPRSGTVFSRGPGGSAVEVVGRSLIASRQQGFHALTDKLRNGKPPAGGSDTVFSVLLAISATHLLNDTVQALIPALYPVVKQSFALNFTQVGLITLVFQLTASLLQPAVGLATDRRPQPYLLVAGMGFSPAGQIGRAHAPRFGLVLAAVG